MKIKIILLFILFACSDNNVEERNCLIAKPKGILLEQYLGCITRKQFHDKDFPDWDKYYDHNWEPCNQCK